MMPTPLGKISFKRLIIWLIIILAILGAGGTYYFYSKYTALKVNPNIEAQKETANLVSTVGKLMELPADETPTVASIVDKEKLKDQAFFTKAENGDRLLAYTKAMLAILYRPSTNKIINVAPIALNQTPPADLSDANTSTSLRLAYFNGTETVGLSGVAEKAVLAKYPNYQTAILANATKKDYQTTLVVDLTGKYSKEAGNLATLLNGKVGPLPQGESAPKADILIISGK